MRFYPHRSKDEQTSRLPPSQRDYYYSTAIDRIEIDGCEILGYFEYSFMEEKSYVEQPVRSQDGSIADIDDYSTFLTPRLIIKYNMMNIEDYRTLMTFLKSKNSFNVTCYDIVADRRVTHEMYFANPQMPIIYQRYLAALGVQDYTIELIGTNRRKAYMDLLFNIDNEVNRAYPNSTWLEWTLIGNSDYKVIYSKIRGAFVISKDNGKTALATDPNRLATVSPHDLITGGYNYTHATLG